MKKKQKKSSKIINIALILILIVGLSLLLYPTVSDYWNSFHQSKAISSYVDEVSNLNEEEYQRLWDEAIAYNQSLLGRSNSYLLNDEQQAIYKQTLSVSSNGVMGYLEVPSINCTLPIYHTTDESVLQVAVGHLEWTSIPTGGESTHCVLSGHRGLPSAKLFTDLDKLIVGDVFMMRVLDEVLTYQVDQILIVEPQETDALQIEEGKDYCTLVTCTPYAKNTHRLLVRGHRIETTEEARIAVVTADATQIDPMVVTPIVATPMLLILLIILMFQSPKQQPDEDE